MKAPARIEQNGVRIARLESTEVSKAHFAVLRLAGQVRREIDRNRDGTDPHLDLRGAASVRKGGGDGAFALPLCLDNAFFADSGHVLIVAGPENFLSIL